MLKKKNTTESIQEGSPSDLHVSYQQRESGWEVGSWGATSWACAHCDVSRGLGPDAQAEHCDIGSLCAWCGTH